MPRSSATILCVFMSFRPSTVARALLSGFVEPSCLPKPFSYPASSSTVRTAPPAMTPVPGPAGRSMTCAEPKRPSARCAKVLPFTTVTASRCFLPSFTAFCTAVITSFALATPTPTLPFISPTTTTARKLSCLPPFTTFVTRLICTTRSSRPSSSRPPKRGCLCVRSPSAAAEQITCICGALAVLIPGAAAYWLREHVSAAPDVLAAGKETVVLGAKLRAQLPRMLTFLLKAFSKLAVQAVCAGVEAKAAILLG
mmetsp:Transcript_12139/g.44288  ORF Transcript_12139/g.44288 Transcript_12139/m.44288 type:complete len:254 (-) Transcript_12139:97-858(-)